MKLIFISLLSLAAFSAHAQTYEYNTVMGGCPADITQATSAHMRPDTGTKIEHAPKTSLYKVATMPETAGNQNKLHSRKINSKGLMQTINTIFLK